MIRLPCPAPHEELKRDPERIRALEYVGIWDTGLDIMELYNCPCGSTISAPGIGPVLR